MAKSSQVIIEIFTFRNLPENPPVFKASYRTLRIRLFHIAIASAGLLTARVAAAQESEYPPVEHEVVVVQSQPEVYEGDSVMDSGELRSTPVFAPASGQPNKGGEAPRLQNKPKASAESVKPSDKKEDVLSFNFLYYFIQRFKLVEIIDE